MKKFIVCLLILGVMLPSFSRAQESIPAPQTIEEAQFLGMRILQALPEAIKRVWQEEALPLWQKMWEWTKPIIEPWWQKFLGLLGKEVEKRKPDLEKKFQVERKEMEKDLWQRFKELLK